MNLRLLALPLALALAGAPLISTPAHAEESDRKEKDERKVLKASDYSQNDISEAYRQAAREKRHEEMEFAKELLSRGTLKGETKAEMMLRLADLYFEEGRDIRLDEDRRFQEAFDACFNDPSCNSENMAADNSESATWQGRSIKLYQQILSNYPTFSRADEASFYMANALWDTDQRKDAVKEFTRLVKSYPESGWVPDAYVMIGEHYFDDNNAYKALLAYQKASAYKNSDKYPFALYKLAWCYYNVGEYGKSIDTMKAVVQYSMSAEAGESRSNLQLQDEALKDLVRFFADAGEMDEAYAYFNKLGKKELIRSMLKRLASTYFEQGKFEECIQTYRRLISEAPDAPEAPEYQNEIISAYTKIGRKKEILAEVERMRKTYGKGSAWAQKNASDPEAIQDAANYLEKNLRTVAKTYHEEARKLGPAGKESYQLAYNAYKVYVEEFPDGKNAYDMHYGFGELLYEIKRFDQAYDEYMTVVKIDPQGKNSKFCAEAAIFASKEMMKQEGSGQQASGPGKSTEPVDLTEWEQKKLDALDQYARIYPDDSKTKNMIYESAYLLYNKNQFDKAADRFRTVISMAPNTTEAEQAANLILDSLALVENWSKLKEVAKAFYDQEGLGSTQQFKTDVYKVYESASLKLIEQDFAKTKDESKAAEAYMAFYGEFPSSENADLALNNAAVYYFNTDHPQKAIDTRLILVEKFPKSKYYKDTVGALGFAYEGMADFDQAAQWYEKLFSLDKDHEGAKAAIYSAALFRNAMGDWQTAIKNYQQYLAAYPEADNVNEITLVIGKTYEENEQWGQAGKVYLTFYDRKDTEGVSADELMFARLHYGQSLEKTGQESKALEHYRKSIDWYKKAAESGVEFVDGREFAGEMLYKLSAADYNKYDNLDVTGPGGPVGRAAEDKILLDQLTAKGKALAELEKLSVEVINTGAGVWGIATLVRLGQAYEEMMTVFQNPYIPSYLTEDQEEMYRMGMEDRAYPQQEKAIQAYSTALEKSWELNLYNDNTAFATRRLGELRPDDFPPFFEEVLDAQYSSSAAVEFDFETQR
jgi:tetratricopeptide (TPR) repeat protein